ESLDARSLPREAEALVDLEGDGPLAVLDAEPRRHPPGMLVRRPPGDEDLVLRHLREGARPALVLAGLEAEVGVAGERVERRIEAREEDDVLAHDRDAARRAGHEVDALHALLARRDELGDEALDAGGPVIAGEARVLGEIPAEREPGVDGERGGEREPDAPLAARAEDLVDAEDRSLRGEDRHERAAEEGARGVRDPLGRQGRSERVDRGPGEDDQVLRVAAREGSQERERDERRRDDEHLPEGLPALARVPVAAEEQEDGVEMREVARERRAERALLAEDRDCAEA